MTCQARGGASPRAMKRKGNSHADPRRPWGQMPRSHCENQEDDRHPKGRRRARGPCHGSRFGRRFSRLGQGEQVRRPQGAADGKRRNRQGSLRPRCRAHSVTRSQQVWRCRLQCVSTMASKSESARPSSSYPSLWFLAHAWGRALRDLNPCEPPAKLLNHLDKLVVGDRFSEVGVTPEGITLLDFVPVICRGENNHRDMFGAYIALQTGQHLNARTSW